MTVVEELRQARQHAGLSCNDIADRTDIPLATLEALEQQAFERLPEDSSLDDLVRAYAVAVGVDGGRMVPRMRRELAARPSHAPDDRALDPMPDSTEFVYLTSDRHASTNADLDAFPAESEATFPGDSDAKSPAESTTANSDELHAAAPATLDTAFDLAPPDPSPSWDTGPVVRVEAEPTRTRRHSPVAFVGIVIALLAAAALGGYWYDSSRRSEVAQTAYTSEQTNDPGDLRAAEDSGGNLAPADAPSPSTMTPSRSSPAADVREPASTPVDEVNARAPSGPAIASPRRAPDPRSEPDPPSAPAAPNARGEPAGAPVALGALGAPAAPPATDVSGTWSLDTRIEASSYRDYEGLQLGYRLELQQDGARVTGRGEKTVESGRPLRGAAQTPIMFQGTISGTRLTLTFVERGLSRSTNGKMILDVTDDGVLRGRFSSTAAQSTGLVEAHRRSAAR